MYGDFSRRQPASGKQYKNVLMQQGRVQLDADWNAEIDLRDHRTTTEAIDVIGRAGAPKVGGGFEITAAGGQLEIGAGRFYLEGELLENTTTTSVVAQPYLPGAALPAQDGSYLVYLEAYVRTVGALDDPALRDVALGGADTTVRTQVVWQVELHRLGAPNAAVAPDAGDAFLAGLRAPRTGRMNAQAVAVAALDRPCLVPAQARYRRLDNLLYRVEIHAAPNGDETGALIKWSRENGAFATALAPLGGARFRLAQIARDDQVRFEQNAWVEVIDDRMELTSGAGVLRRIVQPVDQDRREIVLDAPVPGLHVNHNPRIRLWSQSNGAAGVPMPMAWTELEAGVQVRFEPGTYRPGDFWLIPARAALVLRDEISAGTGDVEWPRNAAGPITQPPAGTPHHYAGLALFDLAGGVWTRRHDLRKLFPPLTAITAEDVSFDNSAGLLADASTVQEAIEELARRHQGGGCTIVIGPGDDVAARVAELAAGVSGRLCFGAGRWVLPGEVLIAGRGHVAVEGVGPGTVLEVGNAESAFRFEDNLSVTVRDVSIITGIGQGDARRTLRGGLHFARCAAVDVDSVRVRTRGQTIRETAGISVHDADSARVARSRIEAGDRQLGILFVDVRRAVVADNEIAGRTDEARPSWQRRVEDRAWLGRFAKELVAEARPGRRPAGDAGREEVRSGDFAASFRTSPGLRNRWAQLLAAMPPERITSDVELLRHLRRIAVALVQGGGVLGDLRAFRGWFLDLFRGEQPAGSRAIVIAGREAREVRVTGNQIARFSGGVHVGLSDHRPGQHDVRAAGRVWIADNAIDLWCNGDSVQDRFGVFSGNCEVLRVHGNDIALQRAPGAPASRVVEGIRIYGRLGRMVQVRENRIDACTTGIRFVATVLAARPQWIVTDNLCPTNPPVRFGDPPRFPEAPLATRVRGEEHNVGP